MQITKSAKTSIRTCGAASPTKSTCNFQWVATKARMALLRAKLSHTSVGMQYIASLGNSRSVSLFIGKFTINGYFQ